MASITRLFLDPEFTDFEAGQLISVAIVGVNGDPSTRATVSRDDKNAFSSLEGRL
jgi:hypothetical protein